MSNLSSDERYKASPFIIDSYDQGQRIDNFLSRVFSQIPKHRVFKAIRKGEVRVGGKRVDHSYKLLFEDQVRVPPHFFNVHDDQSADKSHLKHFDLNVKALVIYEDDHYLALNKPGHIPVHAGSKHSFGLVDIVREKLGDQHLTLVHRLDSEVSGVLLFAKNRHALNEIIAIWSAPTTQKYYKAYCFQGKDLSIDVIDQPLERVKNVYTSTGHKTEKVYDDAITLIKKQKVLSPWFSSFTIQLATGRKHQIRRHLASVSSPIVGDDKYGDFKKNRDFFSEMKIKSKPLFLHCASISFRHPMTKERIFIVAPVPKVKKIEHYINK